LAKLIVTDWNTGVLVPVGAEGFLFFFTSVMSLGVCLGSYALVLRLKRQEAEADNSPPFPKSNMLGDLPSLIGA
jgi:hypothetical protein